MVKVKYKNESVIFIGSKENSIYAAFIYTRAPECHNELADHLFQFMVMDICNGSIDDEIDELKTDNSQP